MKGAVHHSRKCTSFTLDHPCSPINRYNLLTLCFSQFCHILLQPCTVCCQLFSCALSPFQRLFYFPAGGKTVNKMLFFPFSSFWVESTGEPLKILTMPPLAFLCHNKNNNYACYFSNKNQLGVYWGMKGSGKYLKLIFIISFTGWWVTCTYT